MPVRRTKPITLRPESIAPPSFGDPRYYGATRVSCDERWAVSFHGQAGNTDAEVDALAYTITDLESGNSRLAPQSPYGYPGGNSMGAKLHAFGASGFISPPYGGVGPTSVLDPATGTWSDGPYFPGGINRVECVASFGNAYSFSDTTGHGLYVVSAETREIHRVVDLGSNSLVVPDAQQETFLVGDTIGAGGYTIGFNTVTKDGSRIHMPDGASGYTSWITNYDDDHFLTINFLTYTKWHKRTLEKVDTFTTPTYIFPGENDRYITISPEMLGKGALMATEDDYNLDDPYDGSYVFKKWYYSLDLGRTWVYDEEFSAAWSEQALPPADTQVSLAKESPGLGGWATPMDSASGAFGFRRGQAEVCFWTPGSAEPKLALSTAQLGTSVSGIRRVGRRR